MTTIALPADSEQQIGLLDWLLRQAEQNVPEPYTAASVPVAWLGRTSTDDAQDPTLSLPRQLENSRKALPPGFIIVAKFYDIESGRTAPTARGQGAPSALPEIPIARDGGIRDLLAEATRPDRRFVAVIVESIDRVARVTYHSTKFEFDLEQAGVVLLAADEGIDHRAIPSPDLAESPYRKATQVLTRRIKQAISEWYVLNMLELTWGGLKTHTVQGYNIGKPPYGYLPEVLRHPVKARAHEGRTKHRLVADPIRGPVVTQIFHWRATHQLGYKQIAVRLNADPDRYPPPDPILGEGRRRVGAWTSGSVRDVLDNPKHTGYMVWNRRRRGHPNRDISGHANPPSAWVWSSHPTHEPLVTRKLFESASTVGRFRKQPIQQPRSRQYAYSSILACDLCGRRAQGEVHKGLVYYRCSPNPRHHGHLSWFDRHPKTALIREEQLTGPLAALFADLTFDQESSRLLLDDPIAAGDVTEADLRTLPGPLLHDLCTAFSVQMRFHPLTQAITITATLAAPLGHLISRRTAE